MSRSDLKNPKKRRSTAKKSDTTPVPTSPYSPSLYDDNSAGDKGRGEQQYDRIKRIAAELFATRGYRAVGVAEIGDAVQLGRGALYYHINSKEDLLFSIVVRYIEELVIKGREAIETEPDPAKRICILSRQLMTTIFANLSEMTVCFRETDCLTGQRHRIVSELHQYCQEIWATTLREGEKKGPNSQASRSASHAIGRSECGRTIKIHTFADGEVYSTRIEPALVPPIRTSL